MLLKNKGFISISSLMILIVLSISLSILLNHNLLRLSLINNRIFAMEEEIKEENKINLYLFKDFKNSTLNKDIKKKLYRKVIVDKNRTYKVNVDEDTELTYYYKNKDDNLYIDIKSYNYRNGLKLEKIGYLINNNYRKNTFQNKDFLRSIKFDKILEIKNSLDVDLLVYEKEFFSKGRKEVEIESFENITGLIKLINHTKEPIKLIGDYNIEGILYLEGDFIFDGEFNINGICILKGEVKNLNIKGLRLGKDLNVEYDYDLELIKEYGVFLPDFLKIEILTSKIK